MPLVSKTEQHRPIVTMEHSQVADRSVSVLMTLSDLERGSWWSQNFLADLTLGRFDL